MHGKTALITGGTNGIGLETARTLATQGAQVIVTGRNPQKTASVVDELRRSTGNDNIHSLLGDLSLMAETRRLADEFSTRYSRLDLLVNNAGGVFSKRTVTAEGLEHTFALNHMSYYLLTRLLLPTLIANAPARVVSVSSGAHFFSRGVDFDNLQRERGLYIGFARYSESKLMNVMFTLALARRVAASQVTVNTVHPGIVNTGFGQNSFGPLSIGTTIASRLVGLTPVQGAQTTLHVATSAEGGTITGAYWEKSRVKSPSAAASDTAAQERLWEVSATLAGLPTA